MRSPRTAFGLILSLCVGLGASPRLAAGGRRLGPFAAIEARTGGRLGVVALGDGRTLQYRPHERFLLCSTFKVVLAAQALRAVDAGQQALERHLAFDANDLLNWAPVTSKRLGEGGMPLGDLCAAAVQYSDNTAANVLLRALGGPPATTRLLRALGDPVTRLDRPEPGLNSPGPDPAMDTTTPAAMAHTLRKLLLGDALTPASRERLTAWLLGNTTGDRRLRAGLPPGWRAAEKTGTGDGGRFADVGVLYPPDRPPIVIAAFLEGCRADTTACEAALADVARAVVDGFAAPAAHP
jgi:beta-lactamase class A